MERGRPGLIARYGYKPVFQYKFRPFVRDGQLPTDGGFTLLFYENGILSFSTYDAHGLFLDELCFSLPGRVLQCFYGLVRNAASWLSVAPANLQGSQESPYGSSFAYDGYDPIRVFGMNELVCEPCGSAAGFFARHLYVLFEDVSSLFAEFGITMTLDGFSWNDQMIRPFRKNQMSYSARQERGAV